MYISSVRNHGARHLGLQLQLLRPFGHSVAHDRTTAGRGSTPCNVHAFTALRRASIIRLKLLAQQLHEVDNCKIAIDVDIEAHFKSQYWCIIGELQALFTYLLLLIQSPESFVWLTILNQLIAHGTNFMENPVGLYRLVSGIERPRHQFFRLQYQQERVDQWP